MSEQTYKPTGLIQGNATEFQHFHPENGSRDRFGNRFFGSNELSFLDRAGNKEQAGLLVSPDGEAFIKSQPGIVKKIDQGLATLEQDGNAINHKPIDLGKNRSLEYWQKGGQSNVYLLTIGQERYVIKTHTKPATEGYSDGEEWIQEEPTEEDRLDQPFVNEMLQTQAIAEDLKEELSKLNVKMSSFLFASSHVSCTRFEEEEYNFDALDQPRLSELSDKVLGYISSQRHQGNKLWKGVELDRISNRMEAINNFVTKKDGTLVWIDPFEYDVTPKVPGQRYG